MFINVEVDILWPNEKKMNEAQKYPYPYKVSDESEWTLKPFKDRENEG